MIGFFPGRKSADFGILPTTNDNDTTTIDADTVNNARRRSSIRRNRLLTTTLAPPTNARSVPTTTTTVAGLSIPTIQRKKQQQKQKQTERKKRKNRYEHLTTLQIIHYSNFKDIANIEAIQIADALQTNIHVQKITMSHNRQIEYSGCEALCNLFVTNHNIVLFEMTHVLFSPEKVQLFTSLLANNTSSLQSLNLSWNRLVGADIGLDGINEFAQSLLTNTSLTHLYLSHTVNTNKNNNINRNTTTSTNITPPTTATTTTTTCLGQQIGILLRTNYTLQCLDLGSNRLGDEFVIAMAQYLPSNKALRELILDVNTITDGGVQSISQALKTNTTLQKLNLSRNYITDNGILLLMKALEYNTTLTTLLVLYPIAVVRRTKEPQEKQNSTSNNNNNTNASRSSSSSLMEISTLQQLIKTFQYNDTITTFMQTNIYPFLYYNGSTDLLDDNNDDDDDNDNNGTTTITTADADTTTNPSFRTTIDPRRQIQFLLEQNHLQTRQAPLKGTRTRSDIYYWLLLLPNEWNNTVSTTM